LLRGSGVWVSRGRILEDLLDTIHKTVSNQVPLLAYSLLRREKKKKVFSQYLCVAAWSYSERERRGRALMRYNYCHYWLWLADFVFLIANNYMLKWLVYKNAFMKDLGYPGHKIHTRVPFLFKTHRTSHCPQSHWFDCSAALC
jgi:hypothetical protein